MVQAVRAYAQAGVPLDGASQPECGLVHRAVAEARVQHHRLSVAVRTAPRRARAPPRSRRGSPWSSASARAHSSVTRSGPPIAVGSKTESRIAERGPLHHLRPQHEVRRPEPDRAAVGVVAPVERTVTRPGLVAAASSYRPSKIRLSQRQRSPPGSAVSPPFEVPVSNCERYTPSSAIASITRRPRRASRDGTGG